DVSSLHTVVIAPNTNIVGCPVTTPSCTPHYVTVTSPPDSWPGNATLAIAECNFGGLFDPADPGLCDNRNGHYQLTHAEADGSLKQLYDQSNNPLGPIKIPVVTGTIGVPSPILPGSPSRPDSICAPPDAQRANGRNCGIVVADITG